MIKAVIFDCFGVLTADNWREFVAELPNNIDLNKVHDLNKSFGRGFISRADFLSQLKQLTGARPSMTEDINQIHKNKKLLNYIEKLRKRKLRIGLLSNIGSNWIRESLLNKDEQNLFDTMVLSFEVGMTKPDPRIFKLVCKNLSVKESEAILVDDIEHYCVVAEDLGMKAVVYDNFPQFIKQMDELLQKS